MSIKRYLYSAVCVAAIFSGGQVVSESWAQKGEVLTPSSQWAMTKVDESAGQGPPYCAVARRFNPNKVLTIAKNLNEETSFAIDFQRPRLNTGFSYPVILDAGAGQQRVFQTTPASAQAIVVRLGRDTEFFSALKRTGYLRVEVGQEVFNFNLADIDSGQTKLQSCLSGLQTAARNHQIIPPHVKAEPLMPYAETAPAPSVHYGASHKAEKTSYYQQEISELRQEIDALRSRNDEIVSQLAQAQTIPSSHIRMGEMSERLEKVTYENESLREQLAQARKRNVENARDNEASLKLSALKQENLSLQKKLDQMHQEGLSGSVRAEMRSLRHENERLREIVALANGGQSDLENLRLIESLEAENAALMRKLSEVETAAGEEQKIQSRLQLLEAENKKLKSEIQSVQSASDVGTEQSARLLEAQNQIYLLKKENLNLQKSLAEKARDKTDVDSFTDQLSTLKEENDALNKKIAQALLIAKEKDQTEVVRQLRQQISDLTKDVVGKDSRIRKLNAQVLSMEAIEQENKKIGILQAQLDSLQSDLREKNEKISFLKEETQRLAPFEASAKQNEVFKEEIALLNAKLSNKESEIIRLSSLSMELQELKNKNEELQQKLKAQQLELAQAQQDLLSVNKDQQTEQASLETKVMMLEAENAALLQELKAYEGVKNEAVASNSELHKKVEFLTAENDRLETLLSQSVQNETLNQDAQAEIQSLKSENKELLEQVAHLLAENEGAELALQNQMKATADYQEENARMLSRIESLQQDNIAAEQEIVSLSEENKRLLNTEISQNEKQSEGWEQLRKALEENLELREQVTELENKNLMIGQLQDQILALEQERSELFAAKAAAQEGQDAGLIAKVESLESLINTLKEENSDLKMQLAKGEQDLSQADNERVADLTRALKSEEEKNESLQSDLAILQKKLDLAQEEIESLALASAALSLKQTPINPSSAQENQVDAKAQKRIRELEGQLQTLQSHQSQAMKVMAQDYMRLRRQVEQQKITISSAVPQQQASVFQATYAARLEPLAGEELSESHAPEFVSDEPASPKEQGSADDIAVREMEEEQASPEGFDPITMIESAAMTEAQKLEQKMAEDIEAGVEMPVPSDNVPNRNEGESSDSEIILRETQDPFEDMSVENEHDGESEDNPGAVGAMQESTDAVEEVNIDPENTPSDEIDPVDDTGSAAQAVQPKTLDDVVAGFAEEKDEEVFRNEQVQAPDKTTYYYEPRVLIQDILEAVDLPVSKLTLIEAASDQENLAYQWEVEDGFASSLQRPLQQNDRFDDLVKSYLEKTQDRCAGEFAVVPYDTSQEQDLRIDSYDIACIGDDVNAAASILFFSSQDSFTAIAHEGTAADMEKLMAWRDKTREAVSKSL